MQKNIFKKTVTLTYLTAILFSLFFPFNKSLAYPELIIKSDNLTLNSGEYIYISAEISELVNKTITFSSSPSKGVTFAPSSSCTTASGNPSFCSVQFTSTIIGEYTLSAKTEYNGTLESNSIKINVTKKNVSPICKGSQVLDPVTNKCIDCTSPKIIIGGKCEDKVTEEGCNAVNRVLNTTTNRCDCVSPNKEINGTCTTPTTLVPGDNTTSGTTDTTYNPLAPLPGLDTTIDTAGTCPFGNYLNIMIKLVIGISAVLAMVMIVMGGIEYMTSDLISSKEAGKETIKNALLGLFIALGAYLILNTINPKLLSACLDNLPKAEIVISPEEIIKNRSGGGICAPITDSSKPCYPENLKNAFSGTTNDEAPFNTLATQASAICYLESHGIPETSSGVDKCGDGKAFSFGLFQINGSAHRNEIPACNGAFSIPEGHGTSQGNKIPGTYSWTCTTVEPAYTKCKEYLLNPINNITEASKLKKTNKWYPTWSTYLSCQNKFNP